MDVLYEFQIQVDILSPVIFIERAVSSGRDQFFEDARFEVEGEVFLAEDDERHILGIDGIDLRKGSSLSFLICRKIFLE